MNTIKGRLFALWQSLPNSLTRIQRHKVNAVQAHWQAVHARLMIAAQAGDFSTLINDQIELLPDTRARMTAHWQGALLMAERGYIESAAAGREFYSKLKTAAAKP